MKKRLSNPAFIIAVMMIVNASLLAYSATRHSPTLDEPAHLVAGLSHWKFGRFELYRENPPLVRSVAAIPVLLTDRQEDWSGFYEGPGARPGFPMGSHFITANGDRSLWLITIARWACIPFSLLGCWFSYRFARELYGVWPGLLAAALWCFSPSLLAHAELITPDCAATAFGIGATYGFWRWLNRPTWFRAVVAGVLLGLAEFSKSTWIILFGLWPLLWIFWIVSTTSTRQASPKEHSSPSTSYALQGGQLVVLLLTGLYLLNLGYGFEGSLTRLGDYEFVSESLAGPRKDAESPPGGNRFQGTLLAKLPVPLPLNYVKGIDIQKKDFEHWPESNYLRGEWKDGGWWYYYLYAFLVKEPLGLWLLFLLAVICRIRGKDGRHRWRDEVILLAPALVVLMLVSSQMEQNAHYRYVLPTLGLILVWISRVAFISSDHEHRKIGTFARFSLIMVALGWMVISLFWNYPHQLSYFNELAGGRRSGCQHLLGSSVDWGQDLLLVKQWQQSHPDQNITGLHLTALYRPEDIGVTVSLPRGGLSLSRPPGFYEEGGRLILGIEKYLRLREKGEHRDQYSTDVSQLEWIGSTHVILPRIPEPVPTPARK